MADGQVGQIDVSLAGVPELIAALRRELANVLRDAARFEEPSIARRLVAIAAAFEVGQSTEAADGR